MRIDIICSGSKGNCTLIRSGTTSILLDCGPASLRCIRQGLEAAGSDMQSLQAMLITHTHSDHIRQLRHFAWLPVYSPVPIAVRDHKKNPVTLSLHPVTSLMPFRIGRLLITPFALSHDAGPTMGYIIQDESEKLVYMTDTGYVRSDLLPILRGADYYIAESNHDVDMLMHTNRTWQLKQRILSDTGHLSNEDSARLLSRLITAQTRQVVLAHLSEEANTPQLALDCFETTMKEAGMDHLTFDLCCASQNESVTLGTLDTGLNNSQPAQTNGDGMQDAARPPKKAGSACKPLPAVSLQPPAAVPNTTPALPAVRPGLQERPSAMIQKEGVQIPAEMETTWEVFSGISSTLEEEEEFVDPVF